MINSIGDAERLVIYRLLSRMNPTKNGKRVWTCDEVCVTARPISNRFGVPDDASTWIYVFHFPYTPAWTASVRAVWRRGELHRPISTHVQIIDLDDLDEKLGGPNGVLPVLSDWLLSLPL